MKTKFIRQIVVVCLLFFGMSQAHWAQLKEVQLKGKIANTEGQKLGGVSLLLKNISSGKNWKAISGADGGYSFSNLPPGRYELQASLAQYESMNRELNLMSAVELLDVALKPVAAAASTKGKNGQGNRDSAQNRNQRGFRTLTLQAPEGLDASQGANGGAADAGNGGQSLPAMTSIAGNASGADTLVIQGSSAPAGDLSFMGGRFSDDQIRQMRDRIAERMGDIGGWAGDRPMEGFGGGMMGGGQGGRGPGGGPMGAGGGPGMAGMGGGPGGPGGGFGGGRGNMGANRLRGMIYDDYHNSALDARPYSLSGLEQNKASYIQNSFGFMLGGPFQIPKWIKPSEKTFFSIGYNGSRNRNPYDSTVTVPTLLEREGDFSQTFGRAGSETGPVPIYDPLISSGPLESRLFPGNKIPADRIDPIAQGLLSFIPLPNLPGNTLNYHLNMALPSSSDSLSVRLNQRIKSKDNLSFNYSLQSRDSVLGLPFPTLSGNSSNRGQNLTIGWMHNFSSRLFNNWNFRFNRMRSSSLGSFAYVQNVAGNLGIQGISSDPIDYGVPTINFTNFAALQDVNPSLRRNQTAQVSDNVSYVVGKHTLRTGFEYRRIQHNTHNNPNGRGTFVFNGAVTSAAGLLEPQPASGTSSAVSSGYDLADFLLGDAQSTSIRYGSRDTYLRGNALSGYAQDNWKVRSSLTLNLGLRYELTPPYYEKYNHLANLDVAPGFTGVQVVLPGESGAYSGTFPRSLIGTDYNNFSPRVGLAWRPFSKKETVVRAGYGIFFNPSSISSFSTQLASQPPFAFSENLVTRANQVLTLADGFPVDPTVTVTNSYAIDPNYRIGYVQQWNLDIQQTFNHRLLLTVGYNGSKGTGLDLLRAPNRIIQGSQSSLIPGVQSFLYQTSGTSSSYNSAVVRLMRRFSGGISFGGSYVYGKSIDNASSIGGGQETVALFDNNLHLERGLSTFDIRHQLNANWMVELPFGDRKRFFSHPGLWNRLLSEWNWNGNLSMNSGTPLTARVLGNSIGMLGVETSQSLRADSTGLNPSLSDAEQSWSRYFNTAAFAVPEPGMLGNVARNTIPGPGLFNVNMGLGKTIRLSQEGARISFRIQASNVFNHANPSGLGVVVNASNFGQVTSVRQMRQLDFNLRVSF